MWNFFFMWFKLWRTYRVENSWKSRAIVMKTHSRSFPQSHSRRIVSFTSRSIWRYTLRETAFYNSKGNISVRILSCTYDLESSTEYSRIRPASCCAWYLTRKPSKTARNSLPAARPHCFFHTFEYLQKFKWKIEPFSGKLCTSTAVPLRKCMSASILTVFEGIQVSVVLYTVMKTHTSEVFNDVVVCVCVRGGWLLLHAVLTSFLQVSLCSGSDKLEFSKLRDGKVSFGVDGFALRERERERAWLWVTRRCSSCNAHKYTHNSVPLHHVRS